MKIYFLGIIIFFGAQVFCVEAKLQSSYHILESDMKTEDCINIAKKSRGVLFTEKFGEIISDNLYDYLRDDLHISVLCLTKKSTIVLVVAAENKDVLEYINFFAKQYKSQGAATMDESN